jgi:hypothetical protein
VTTVPTTEPGAARAFPAGRLSDFEDAGAPGDQDSRLLSGLLTPRSSRPRPAAVPAAGPEADAAPAVGVPASEPSDQPSDEDPGQQDDAVPAATANSAVGTDIDRLGEGIRTAPPSRRGPARRPRAPQAPDETAQVPAAAPSTADEPGTEELGAEDAGPAGNRLRASNVHIPASFMPRLSKARTDRRLSNGEWVIVALEATHDQLGGLIRPQPTGGSLFAPRATRAARTYDGPLTPFNIRLREADYAVIDQLVEQFGASSRGHLITVAFDAFLPTV